MDVSRTLRASQKAGNVIRLSLTAGTLIGSYLMLGMATCGCHFHAAALIPTFLPLAWSFRLLLTAHEQRAKALAWAVFLFALFLIYVGFYSNIVFLFR